MATNVLVVKEKVQRYLTDMFGSVKIDSDGDFMLKSGSSTVFVGVKPWGDENTVVRLFSLMNVAVPPSAELFEFVATKSYFFGNVYCSKKDDGVTVFFAHSLLGEFLDPDEFKTALFMVGQTADELDDEIKKKFGGRLFGGT